MMRIIIIGTAIGVLCVLGFGGVGTITGKERKSWTTEGSGRLILVLAEVWDVAEQPDVPLIGTHRATLIPLATLAGSFDPTSRPTLEVTMEAGPFGTNLRHPPPKGEIIMAVLQGIFADPGDEVLSYWIVGDVCKFMPDERPVYVVQDLNDPKIIETIDRIRAARANPNPSPYPPATTNPTTRPLGTN